MSRRGNVSIVSGAISTTIRTPESHDWPRILELATSAVEHVSGQPAQQTWLRNRRDFDGQQRQFVAERDGEVVGYGAVERRPDEPEGSFRIFLVTSWAEDVDVADSLYATVEEELTSLGARWIWMREYASDAILIGFVRERGFRVLEEYDHEGTRLVTLAKEPGSRLAG